MLPLTELGKTGEVQVWGERRGQEFCFGHDTWAYPPGLQGETSRGAAEGSGEAQAGTVIGR